MKKYWSKFVKFLKDVWEKRKILLITTLRVAIDFQFKPMIIQRIKEEKDKISPEDIAEKVAKIQKDCMEAAFNDFVKTVPNKVDVYIDNCWKKD